MEMCRKVFQEVAGEDESGNGRALSCLMILASDGADAARQYLENAVQGNGKEIDEGVLAEMWSGDQGYEPEVCGAVYMSDAVLSIRFTGDFAVVDLRFEDCVDFDYLRAGELCRKFDVLADTGKPEEEKVDYSLVLSAAPKGECDAFFVGLDGVWSFISEESEGICHIIRLVFAREKFGVYEFGKEAVEDLIPAGNEPSQRS
jgi:hypothetical protein